MADPCIQGPNIDRLTRAVENIAATNVRLDHIEDTNRGLKEDMNGLFDRVRTLEVDTGKVASETKLEILEAITEIKDANVIAMADVKKQLSDGLKGIHDTIDDTNNFVKTLRSKPYVFVALALGVMTLIGTICDLEYHSKLTIGLFTWFK